MEMRVARVSNSCLSVRETKPGDAAASDLNGRLWAKHIYQVSRYRYGLYLVIREGVKGIPWQLHYILREEYTVQPVTSTGASNSSAGFAAGKAKLRFRDK